MKRWTCAARNYDKLEMLRMMEGRHCLRFVTFTHEEWNLTLDVDPIKKIDSSNENNDDEVHIDLDDGEYIFINFWIITPSIVDGAPLAGTGPTFTLEAESNLDKRVESWTFSLEMQTFHNMTVDIVIAEICWVGVRPQGWITRAVLLWRTEHPQSIFINHQIDWYIVSRQRPVT